MSRRRRPPLRRSLTLGLLLTSLLACGGLAPPSPFTVDGVVAETGTVALPQPLSLVVLDPDAIDALPSVVEQVTDEVWSLATGTLDASGAFSLTFPVGAEMPDALMFPAAEAIADFGFDSCAFTASNPDALVSWTAFAFGGLPMPTIVIGDATGSPDAFLVFTDAALDGDPSAELNLQGWMYATASTTIVGSCLGDLGGGPELAQSVNVTLAPGWNRVVQHLVVDGPGSLSSGTVADGSWQVLSD